MIFWIAMNSLFRVGITVIASYKLTMYRDMFNQAERIGMGLFGGASFLTIPQLWVESPTPFEAWAGTVFSAGLFIYLCGRMTRHWRHARNNRQSKQARKQTLASAEATEKSAHETVKTIKSEGEI